MEFNKGNLKIIIALILGTLIVWTGLQNLGMIATGLSGAVTLLLPFIIGGAIAFVLNIPMELFEEKIFSQKLSEAHPAVAKIKRPVSLVLAFLSIAVILAVASFLIFPQMVDTISSVGDKLPGFISGLQAWALKISEQYPRFASAIKNLTTDWGKIASGIESYLQKTAMSALNSTVDWATNVVGTLVSFFIGLIFAIYVLLQKETLGVQIRKLLYAYLPEKNGDSIVRISGLSSDVFKKFVTGQCTEAVIIGVLFFISMSLFRLPYAVMVAVLIAVLSLIPIFGTMVGCVIGALLICINSPVQALEFLVLFIIVQQIEGNLIYPHVVGGSVGLPAIWVLVAVTIGGNAWGVLGMILFIPICSILYTLMRETVGSRLDKRQLPAEKWNGDRELKDGEELSGKIKKIKK